LPLLKIDKPYVYNHSLYILDSVEGNVVSIRNMCNDYIRVDAKDLIPTTYDQIDVWLSSIKNGVAGPNIKITNEEADNWRKKIVEVNDGKAITSYF